MVLLILHSPFLKWLPTPKAMKIGKHFIKRKAYGYQSFAKYFIRKIPGCFSSRTFSSLSTSVWPMLLSVVTGMAKVTEAGQNLECKATHVNTWTWKKLKYHVNNGGKTENSLCSPSLRKSTQSPLWCWKASIPVHQSPCLKPAILASNVGNL